MVAICYLGQHLYADRSTWLVSQLRQRRRDRRPLVSRYSVPDRVLLCDDDNRVLVDGRPLNEPYRYYTPVVYPPRQERFDPVTVPAGQLWLMGDSRNNSQDSRWPGQGPVPAANVIGKARFVVLPLRRAGIITQPDPQNVSPDTE